MEVLDLHNLDDNFKSWFPNCNYALSDLQKKAITNVLDNGNTLCIMPTGSGKSTVYWMTGLELDGITIAISPLTALISEQAEKIAEHGICEEHRRTFLKKILGE